MASVSWCSKTTSQRMAAMWSGPGGGDCYCMYVQYPRRSIKRDQGREQWSQRMENDGEARVVEWWSEHERRHARVTGLTGTGMLSGAKGKGLVEEVRSNYCTGLVRGNTAGNGNAMGGGWRSGRDLDRLQASTATSESNGAWKKPATVAVWQCLRGAAKAPREEEERNGRGMHRYAQV